MISETFAEPTASCNSRPTRFARLEQPYATRSAPGAETAQAVHGEAADLALRRDEFHASVGRLSETYVRLHQLGPSSAGKFGEKSHATPRRPRVWVPPPCGPQEALVRCRYFHDPPDHGLEFRFGGFSVFRSFPGRASRSPRSRILVQALSSSNGRRMYVRLCDPQRPQPQICEDRRTDMDPDVGSLLRRHLDRCWFRLLARHRRFDVFWHPDLTVKSLIGLSDIVRRRLNIPYAPDTPALLYPTWLYLLLKISTAFPWFLVGAVAAAMLVYRLGGDVRRTHWRALLRDGFVLGGTLASRRRLRAGPSTVVGRCHCRKLRNSGRGKPHLV